MEAKTKKWLIIGGIVLVAGIVGAVLYKKKKEKDRIKKEEEEAKAEVPIPYEVIKKVMPSGKEVQDSYIVTQKTGDKIGTMRFYKNNRMGLFIDNKLVSKGSYADGGKTSPSIKITLDNGKVLEF